MPDLVERAVPADTQWQCQTLSYRGVAIRNSRCGLYWTAGLTDSLVGHSSIGRLLAGIDRSLGGKQPQS